MLRFVAFVADMISQIPLISFLITFITILLLKIVRKKPAPKLPPGPGKIPVIGNLHQLGELPHRSLQQLSTTYGDLMHLQLGSVSTIVVSSAHRARQIFKNHDLVISGRPPLYSLKKLSYNYSSISFAPYGEPWRQVRKILVLELMTAKRVDSFRGIRVQEVSRMIDRMSSSVPNPVDLSALAFALSISVVSRAAFGASNDVVGSGSFKEIFRETQQLAGEFNVADYFPGLRWINRINGVDRRIDENFRDLDRFLDRVIQDHRRREGEASDSENEDIIDALLRIQKDSSQTFCLTDEQIKGLLLIDIYVAGTDTSAATIEWTMAELMRNPRMKEKAQIEVRQIGKGKARLEETDLPDLKFLKQVIKESLRLHPPAPLLVPRETTELCIIDDKFRIPAKTRVIVNTAAIATDPKVWENPKEFMPERFENSQVDYRGKHFELLPFGAGRRGCPGMNFAMPVVELALANLLFCFDWKLPDGMSVEDVDMVEATGITMHKKTPICLVATFSDYHLSF